MIFIKNVNGKDYAVKVHHNVVERVTSAEIFVGNAGENISVEVPVGVGKAMCHAEDSYNKAVGRRLAISRAIQTAIPRVAGEQPVEREQFWLKYNMQVKA